VKELMLLDIVEDTTVDGPGFRTALYASGCGHQCSGCHNPHSWEQSNGRPYSIDDILNRIKAAEFANVTFSGGDPLYQVESFTELARRIKRETHKTIWCYTGFRYEEVVASPRLSQILPFLDVLVDGTYEKDLSDESLLFVGSSNQRLIDVPSSSPSGEPALWRMAKVFLALAVILVLSACGGKVAEKHEDGEHPFSYACGLQVEKENGYTVVEVHDPWNGGTLQRYVLVKRDEETDQTKELPEGTILKIPLRRIVVYSSVHAGMIDALGEIGAIIGVCEGEYMGLAAIRQGLLSGTVADLGMSASPNIEQMLALEAEAVIASPFQNGGYGQVEKTGIPIIECADYMEAHPLGRVEWLLFFGLLLDKEEEAKDVFEKTAERYEALSERVKEVEHRPRVFAELPYGGTWWVSPAGGYMACLFQDAGAEYVFGNREGTEALPLSAETVLDEAIDADFWLIKYNREEPLTYASLEDEHPSYPLFDAFKKRQVFACHTGLRPYYEETPLHPDMLLADFIGIFHPDLLPAHSPRYYMPLP
jgi:iron complex transport system substrate-binding protein